MKEFVYTKCNLECRPSTDSKMICFFLFFFEPPPPRLMPLLLLGVEVQLDQSHGLGRALDLHAPRVLDAADHIGKYIKRNEELMDHLKRNKEH